MVRYTLTLPTHGNAGRSLADQHAQSAEYLLAQFGAYTVHAATGAWSGADRDYTEPVTVYVVDAPDTSESYAKLHALAQYLKLTCEQEAVYLTRQPVKTFLI